jgi:mycothiol synthase
VTPGEVRDKQWVELAGEVPEELVRLARRCLVADGGLPLAADPGFLRRRWAAEGAVRFGLRGSSGELIAAAAVRPGPEGPIATGLVDPSARGCGVGGRLLDHALVLAGQLTDRAAAGPAGTASSEVDGAAAGHDGTASAEAERVAASHGGMPPAEVERVAASHGGMPPAEVDRAAAGQGAAAWAEAERAATAHGAAAQADVEGAAAGHGGTVRAEVERVAAGAGVETLAWGDAVGDGSAIAAQRAGEAVAEAADGPPSVGAGGGGAVVTVETESLTAKAAALFGSRGLRQVFAEDVLFIDLGWFQERPRWPVDTTVTSWTAKNAERFFAVHVASFRERPGYPGPTAAEWIGENEEDDEFRPRWSLLATLPEIGDAGFVTAAVGWIVQVGVAPAARRRGLGRALVTEALRRMAADGEPEAWLNVNVNNPGAARLYRDIGFTDRGRRARFRF